MKKGLFEFKAEVRIAGSPNDVIARQPPSQHLVET